MRVLRDVNIFFDKFGWIYDELRLALFLIFPTPPTRESNGRQTLSYICITNHSKVGWKWKKTSQENNVKGRRPQRKMTLKEENITGRQHHRKTTSHGDELRGKRPNRKLIQEKDNLAGRNLTVRNLTGRNFTGK